MGGRTKRDKREWRKGGPVTCDWGQIRVGTRFELKEDEVSNMCQQFVEFGRVSLNTDALLGEAPRDVRLFAESKTPER